MSLTNEETVAEEVTSRDVAKGAGTTLIARLGGVIDVVAQPLYVWLFGLAGYGLYAVLWATVNLIENIADLGMTSALQRTVPQAKSERDAVASLRAAFLMGVGPCLLIAGIVTLIPTMIMPLFNASDADAAGLARKIAVFVWTLPLWAFIEVATSALRARRVFGPEIRLRLFWEQVARMGFAVSLWAAGLGTMALIYAHVLSLIIICILCVRLLRQHYDFSHALDPVLRDSVWDDTLKAGLAVLPYNIVARLFGDAPALVLNAMLPGAQGAVAGGLFIIARKISSIVQLVRTAFAYVLAPLASVASTGKRESVSAIYGFATRVSVAVALPLGVVLAAFGEAVLFTFGREARIALFALVGLTIARIVEAVLGAAVPIQQVLGGYRGQIVGSIVGFAVAALLGFWLVGVHGLSGMTIAVSTGLIIAAIIPMWQLHHYDGLHPFAAPFWRVTGKAIGISGVALVVAYGINLGLMELLQRFDWVAPVLQFVLLLVPVLLMLLGALWMTARFALPADDRSALGKTGKKLRLS